jgi:hypothetical protein
MTEEDVGATSGDSTLKVYSRSRLLREKMNLLTCKLFPSPQHSISIYQLPHYFCLKGCAVPAPLAMIRINYHKILKVYYICYYPRGAQDDHHCAVEVITTYLIPSHTPSTELKLPNILSHLYFLYRACSSFMDSQYSGLFLFAIYEHVTSTN